MQRLADLRTTLTLDSATELFNRLARAVLALEAKDAACERRLADLKLIHERQTAELREAIQADSAKLTAFIEANRHLFKDPRKVKTSLGAFGLQAASELLVNNQEALLNAIMENGYDDCVKVVRTLIKPAIRKRIDAGEKLPGAAVRSGDTAVYAVDRALIDKARKGQQE